MVKPYFENTAAYYCHDCEVWYLGHMTEKQYLDGDHEHGTALDECDTYTATKGECGCEEENTSFTIANKIWRCGSCSSVHGESLEKAIECCERYLRRRIQKQPSGHEVIRIYPKLNPIKVELKEDKLVFSDHNE